MSDGMFRFFVRLRPWESEPGSPHNEKYEGGKFETNKNEDYWIRTGLSMSAFQTLFLGQKWCIGHIAADTELGRPQGAEPNRPFQYEKKTGIAAIEVTKEMISVIIYPRVAQTLDDQKISTLSPFPAADMVRAAQLGWRKEKPTRILGRDEFNLLFSPESPTGDQMILDITAYASWPVDSDGAITPPGTNIRFHKQALEGAIKRKTRPYRQLYS